MKNPIQHIDQQALRQFLISKKLIDKNEELRGIEVFSNGYSNQTFCIQLEGKDLVLRHPPKGATKRGHDMSREYKVLSTLHKEFSLAPKALAFSEDLSILGAPFYIMEKVDGIILTLKETTHRDISSKEFKKISANWLQGLILLHQTDYKKANLTDLGKPEGYINRQVTNWAIQYKKAATQEVPEAEFVINWLDKNHPIIYDHTLIHNDYKYDNVVFKDESWNELTGVLDWEMCTLGDPLMDLGTSLAYWTMESDGPMVAQGLPSPTSIPGNPSRTELVDMYAEKSGKKMDKIVFYYVYGLFKIAVIAQQIFYRYQKGFTQNPKFAELDKASHFLCLMGKQAIQKNRIEKLF